MQTISFLLFRLQESGLGSQDILSETPLYSFWNHFYTRGKRQHMFFCVLIFRFRQFGAEKNFINSLSFFFKVVKNHLKREKKKLKKCHFFPLSPNAPRIRIRYYHVYTHTTKIWKT